MGLPRHTRRRFLQTAVALPAAVAPLRAQNRRHVLVVGAGAFGGWTALYLLRRGARVTLVDAWGPGNSRASSGGETRVIRATYGPDRQYVALVARALQLWREHEKRWQRSLMYSIGALWMVSGDGKYERASIPLVKDAGLTIEELTGPALSKRYPQIDFDGVQWALFEPSSGYLLARQACEAVLNAFVAEGGEYRQAFVTVEHRGGEVQGVRSPDKQLLSADVYVFAGGPWLGTMLPEVFGPLIQPHATGSLLLRHATRRFTFRRGHAPVLDRQRTRAVLRDSRQPMARLQDRGRHERTGVRSDRRRAVAVCGAGDGRTTLSVASLSCAQIGAASRGARLPIRKQPGRPLHHR